MAVAYAEPAAPIVAATVDRPHGMQAREIAILCRLAREEKCRSILEVGMANGSSTVALLQTLEENGGGTVTSIDPFQNRDENGVTYAIGGQGMRNVAASGLAHRHRLMEAYDYIALPQLLGEGARFDMIFIDGYHSFDYTFLDFFYADLLLKEGGVCAFHDTGWPTVYKVTDFLMKNKEYAVVGPRPSRLLGHAAWRGLRRGWHMISGRDAEMRERRTHWGSVAAFRKLRSSVCAETKLVNF
ncbi:MAG TPA: class I SAM-dependent methyltransferase [Stellaceae bacterium]|nr:class I SAM-dependent methyltransferase [Stellaceae bacterium]